MRWTFILECRAFGSLGTYGDRIVMPVWEYRRDKATAKAIAGAVAAGWEVGRVIRGEPDLDVPEDRIVAPEARLMCFALDRVYDSLHQPKRIQTPSSARETTIWCDECQDGEVWIPRRGGNDPEGRYERCQVCGGTGKIEVAS